MSTRTRFPRRPFHPLTLAAAGRSLAMCAALAMLVTACSHDARTPVAPDSQGLLTTTHTTSNSTFSPVIFTRTSATGEQFAPYSATFTPPQTGNYTLGFNLTAGGPTGDNSIFIDAVNVTNGATTVFSDGFETPALASNNGVSTNGGSATFGAWAFSNYSGILNGSPPHWGLAGPNSIGGGTGAFTLAPADGTHQYAYLQAAGGTLGMMKAVNTLALVAGQTYTVSFYQASRYDFGGTTTYTVTLEPVQAPTTTTVTFGSGPFPYTGSAYTATASVSSGGSATIAYSGDCTNAGSSCTATATYAGDATHAPSNATANITIAKATSTTTVSFGASSFVYTGSAFTATASVSPSGTAAITYSGDCTNAGNTCSATATYGGDINHSSSTSPTASITIAKAPSTITVTFGPAPYIYKGSAFTATASVSPSGTATITYSGDCTNAGNPCTATATYAGDTNHLGSINSADITVTKAPTTTTVSFGTGPFVYTGSAFVATAASSASTSLVGGPVIAYSGDCVNGGTTCTATATYAGDANHFGSAVSASITITYAICAASGDDDGAENRSIEPGSTIPVKVRVCGASGRNVGSRSLIVKAVGVSPTGSLNDSGRANRGNLFRLDDETYMFNLSTKGFTAGNYTLDFTIGSDPTIYHYAFTIRAAKSKDDGKDSGDKRP